MKRFNWNGDESRSGTVILYSDYQDEVSQIRAEVESLRKDAERYRWLRDTPWSYDPHFSQIIRLQKNAICDEKIDEAMGAKA